MKRRAAVLLRPADLDFSQNSRFISPSPTSAFVILCEDLPLKMWAFIDCPALTNLVVVKIFFVFVKAKKVIWTE